MRRDELDAFPLLAGRDEDVEVIGVLVTDEEEPAQAEQAERSDAVDVERGHRDELVLQAKGDNVQPRVLATFPEVLPPGALPFERLEYGDRAPVEKRVPLFLERVELERVLDDVDGCAGRASRRNPGHALDRGGGRARFAALQVRQVTLPVPAQAEAPRDDRFVQRRPSLTFHFDHR